MPSDLVLQSQSGGVVTLTLNRPEARNALSLALMHALDGELEKIDANPRVRVVVIKGAGAGFCSGHDMRELQSLDHQTSHRRLFIVCSRLMERVVHLRCPVIAQVHGVATAAGLQLVASCDLAVAADTAQFSTPGVNIGLFCSTPMVALTRAVGRKAAMEMLLTGEMVDAAEAQRLGLINRVVPEADLAGVTAALAAKIASRSSFTVAIGKKAFYEQAEMRLGEAYEHTASVMTRNLHSHDAAEGIDAFLHKRAPVWHDG